MEIIDIYNNKSVVSCLGCAIATGEFVPLGGLILDTEHFCVNQDCEVPIPGFIIVSSKRHIQSVDEFTSSEQRDFIDIVVRLRRGMREVLDIQQINIVMVENGEHHLHFWFLPISQEMSEKFGFGTKSIKPIMNYALDNLKTSENIKLIEEFVQRLREYLANN